MDEVNYEALTRRNEGYIPSALQEKIRGSALLIAGCGLGSVIAEVAVRTGFEKLILADGDTVSVHNLNRQTYRASDVGKKKVDALSDHLGAINPAVQVRCFDGFVNADSASKLVSGADMVIDTIDFLDLAGITALHDACRLQARPVLSAVSMGWGAAVIFFPSDSSWTFRKLVGLPAEGSVDNASYATHFSAIMRKLASAWDPELAKVMMAGLTLLEDGRPCPAPQLSVGAEAVASLVVTMAVRTIAGLPVTSAPELVITDCWSAAARPGVDLSG